MRTALATLAYLAAVYLLGVFIFWEPNAGLWPTGGRLTMVALAAFTAPLTAAALAPFRARG